MCMVSGRSLGDAIFVDRRHARIVERHAVVDRAVLHAAQPQFLRRVTQQVHAVGAARIGVGDADEFFRVAPHRGRRGLAAALHTRRIAVAEREHDRLVDRRHRLFHTSASAFRPMPPGRMRAICSANSGRTRRSSQMLTWQTTIIGRPPSIFSRAWHEHALGARGGHPQDARGGSGACRDSRSIGRLRGRAARRRVPRMVRIVSTWQGVRARRRARP